MLPRPLALAGLFVVAACGTTDTQTASPGIQGVVTDSLTGEPLAGVLLFLDSYLPVMSTGENGVFILPYPDGATAGLVAQKANYEDWVATVKVNGDTRRDIPMRRLAPYVRERKGDSVKVVDLQGALTIRWNQAAVSYAVSDGTLTYFVNFPSDLVLGPDSFTATLLLHPPTGATGPVKVMLGDITGYFLWAQCTHTTGLCSTDSVTVPY